MGRPPNPKGKEKARTISLDGDVSEIAQRLASKSLLSHTLSALLRKEFGVATALEAAQTELKQLITERDQNAQAQELAIARIDQLEKEAMQRKTTIIPAIEMRLEKLYARKEKTERDMNRAFTPQDVRAKERVIANIEKIIEATLKELEEVQ